MKNNILATLILTATLSMMSGALFAADTASDNNGQANSAADAGQHAPDAHQNVAPNDVDNSNVNNSSSGTLLHPNGATSDTQHMSKDEIHKTPCAKTANARTSTKKLKPVMG